MTERSQAVTWKLLGVDPARRVCCVCDTKMTSESWAGYETANDGTLRIWCRECHPARKAA